jgi:hypothetical protein
MGNAARTPSGKETGNQNSRGRMSKQQTRWKDEWKEEDVEDA